MTGLKFHPVPNQSKTLLRLGWQRVVLSSGVVVWRPPVMARREAA